MPRDPGDQAALPIQAMVLGKGPAENIFSAWRRVSSHGEWSLLGIFRGNTWLGERRVAQDARGAP